MVIKAVPALMLVFILGCATSSSIKEDAPIWNKVEKDEVKVKSTIANLPETYLLFQLNVDSLKRNLNIIDKDFKNLEVVIPTPNGDLRSFTFEKSSVMSEKLAAKFPDLHSFKGKNIEDPSKFVRFEWTPSGFTAMFNTEEGQVFVQPYNKEDINYYICFYKNEIKMDKEPFEKPE